MFCVGGTVISVHICYVNAPKHTLNGQPHLPIIVIKSAVGMEIQRFKKNFIITKLGIVNAFHNELEKF